MAITPQIETDLRLMGLNFMADQYSALATKAARDAVGHVDYLARLTAGELNLRRDRATLRRIKTARFPVVKTVDQFSWSWPKKISRMAIQDLFRLKFIDDRATVIFLGTVGLAALLHRDYKNVHQDVQILEESGLTERDAKNHVMAPYEKLTIELLLKA